MSQTVLANGSCTTRSTSPADSFAKSIALIACLLVLQRGIGFLRSLYVCGVLSPAEVGQWDLAFSFLTLVAPLAVLGIPGTFGRYVTVFDRAGERGRFLRHSSLACLCLVLVTSGLLLWCRTAVSQVLFGSTAHGQVVALLAAGLPLVVGFNFASCWLTGHRLNRLVFRMQLAQSVFFAVLCVLMLQTFSVTAVAVILAYLASCFFGVLLACSYVSVDFEAVEANQDIGRTSIWSKVFPFAIWVWLSNLLINLFAVCDRLLLVNCYPAGDIDVQAQVGQYHSSRIVPLLLLSLGAMVGSIVTPYLSKDWEAGDRPAVSRRLATMIKLTGLTCLGGAIAVMWVAPILFQGLWQDKFAMGESLLPLTLSYCSLAAMTLVAQKYFWCLEKTWYSSVVLMVGVALNLGLGIAFIVPFGIQGVIVSTLIAHAVVLAGVLWLGQRQGMSIDCGIVVIAFSLVMIAFGKWAACAAGAGLCVAVVRGQWLLDNDFKRSWTSKLKSQWSLLKRSVT